MTRAGKVIALLLAVLFLFGLAVQYNDPDPLPWMAIYAAAALACILAAVGRLPRWLPAIVTLVAAVWAVALAPGVIGQVNPLEMFEEFEMKSPQIEQAREMFGLLIIAVVMLALLALQRRRVER
jgi:hypothetical protein